MYVRHMCARACGVWKRALDLLKLEFRSSYKTPSMGKLGPVQEQQVILTTKPFPQSHI